MHPVLFHLSIFGRDFTVATYGVLVAAASIIAYSLALRLSRHSEFKRYIVSNSLLIIGACGLGGAYITGILMNLPQILETGIDKADPALVSWGGILGGTAAALVLVKSWKLKLAPLADLLSPSYLLGIGIGRIGCFFGGCCFGVHTDCPIGVTFTDPIAPATATFQPVIPTQLISAAYLIVGGMLFAGLYKKKLFAPGRLFAFSAIFYSAGRFTVEFFRNDYRIFFHGLSDGQLFSIAFFCGGIITLAVTQRRKSSKNPGGS